MYADSIDAMESYEFKLRTRRRADLIALSRDGQISIVEIKSSPQDFLSDGKWTEYLQWADKYYFGVGEDFPLDILPKKTVVAY